MYKRVKKIKEALPMLILSTVVLGACLWAFGGAVDGSQHEVRHSHSK